MLRASFAIILALFEMLTVAQAGSTNKYNNEKQGVSFKYSDEFHLIESKDKSRITISIGDMVGNTLNGGVSIVIQKKLTKSNGFIGFINNEREKYSPYKNEVTETELVIDKKYHAIEINRKATAIGMNIKYTIIELPNKNEVLTIQMVTEIKPKIELLKKRTEKALKQYSNILKELEIY